MDRRKFRISIFVGLHTRNDSGRVSVEEIERRAEESTYEVARAFHLAGILGCTVQRAEGYWQGVGEPALVATAIVECDAHAERLPHFLAIQVSKLAALAGNQDCVLWTVEPVDSGLATVDAPESRMILEARLRDLQGSF